MDTCGKTNTEFHNEVNETLARHESSFDQIYNVEQYFDFKNVGPDQQVQLASFHLEGIALQWYRWLTKFCGPFTRDEFTTAVQLRFGPTDYEDPLEALTRLKQTTTVAAYQEAFEKLSHQLQRKPVQQIRSQLALVTPRALPNPTAGVLGPPPTQHINQSSTTQPATFRQITNQEARERREKGLCYYCDEKFIPGHRCERSQLFMIEDSPHTGIEDVESDQLEPEPHEALPKISFHAIAGTEHPQTIRVLGKLKNKHVTVLIEGGSTHNFIDQAVVSKFELPIIQDKKFQVMVANREKIECAGQCRALTLTIQGFPSPPTITFFLS
ncbi:hypothetical protein Patl1_35304 [Pistacia atlantica]|nr:hypothetical protein Patl1_35304 [Pistacia atlantica]